MLYNPVVVIMHGSYQTLWQNAAQGVICICICDETYMYIWVFSTFSRFFLLLIIRYICKPLSVRVVRKRKRGTKTLTFPPVAWLLYFRITRWNISNIHHKTAIILNILSLNEAYLMIILYRAFILLNRDGAFIMSNTAKWISLQYYSSLKPINWTQSYFSTEDNRPSKRTTQPNSFY